MFIIINLYLGKGYVINPILLPSLHTKELKLDKLLLVNTTNKERIGMPHTPTPSNILLLLIPKINTVNL